MKQVLFEQVISPTVKLLRHHITRHLGHVICTTKQLTRMAERMNHLNSICKDVESHKTTNAHGVAGWLTEVEKVKEKVESISINDQSIGCLNLKMRYEAGRKASKATETIEKLIIQNSEFVWTDAPIPIGRVNRKPASSFGDVFKSRERPFNDTLKLLQLDDTNSQVIALCGMGGIGKTTMMEQLLRAEEINRIFDCLVKVVIGSDVNILSIQQAVAEYILPEGLVEGTKAGRASRLHERWKVMLDREKKRILLILDDVWEKFELKDIGLTSPLPEGVKLLLTSRNSGVCKQIATAADSAIQVVTIDVLEEAEAQILFSRNTGLTEAKNSDLYHIVKKCGGLPLAIKHVASTFKYEEDRVLDGALSRRFSNYYVDEDLYDIMQGVFQPSFDHIGEDEDKMIFLHCGLFPKDYDISIEYLARYAWGLKLLKNVSTFREVRKRTRKCVHSLMDANLLMSSDHLGCVKMHVLVLSFVLGRVSKGDHPTWIINHDDFSNWGSIETNKTTCTRISLTCRRGLSTFPSDFKYPSLSLLQLMNRDMVQFPKYFYENMETLQVIAYYKMHHPLLPRSLQCSTSLTTLLLHKCTLESNNNYSFVGDLVNLEVLSFAHCGIRKLPSMIGNLKKLKLLDLSGCVDLHIDDGVFRNLHSLEELYMRVVSDDDRKAAIRFTDANWEELKILLLKQLYALEAEFVEKKTRLESVSFSRLEKFKISIGCLLDEEEEEDPFTNTLKIVTSNSKNEILDCQINELFKETEKLHLQVQDMSALENIVPVHSYCYSFCNLRDLTVFNCAELKYLFPIPIASGLRKLERLKVSSCSVLKTLVCDNGSGSEINSGAGEMMINFEALKFLSLEKLPKLVSLFLVDDIVIELPQLVELEVDGLPNFTSISALLNTQVKIGKLEKLKIGHMEKLKQIWTSSSEEEVNNISMLKEIKVVGCDSLVNPFPTNLLGLLRHLEVVELKNCRCIKEILNVDLGRGGEVHNLWNSLRRIRVEGCDSLVNLFPTNLLGLLDHLEEVEVERCGSIKELFNIDLGLDGEVEQVSSNLRSIRVEGCDSLVNLFPANLLDHLEEIEVNKCRSIKEIFNFDMECVGHEIERVSINLRSIRVERCDSLVNLFPIKLLGLLDHLKEVEVKKCGSIKEIFNIDFGGDGEVGHVWNSLRSIRVEGCDSLVNLFPTNPMGLLNHLKEVEVKKCGSIKEIFSIHLWGAGDFEQVSSSLRSILVEGCDSLVNLFSINPVGLVHHLEELKVKKGGSIKLIFDIDLDLVSQIEQLSRSSFRSIEVFYLEKVREVWRMNGGENNFSLLISGFESLERIKVEGCKGFKSVFTPTNTKFHMGALRDIVIKDCRESGRNMELVKDSHHKEIKFLSSNGRDDNVSSAAFPSNFNYLDTGNSNGLEMVFDIKNQSNRNNEEPLLPNLVGLDFSVMERMSHMWKCNNWNNFLYFQKQHQQSSFHNLTTIRIRHCKNIKYLISSHMAKLLSNLKTIQISHCDDMEEVVLKGVETYESVASTSTHANTTFFPCLHLLSFEYMRDLKRIDGGDVRDRLKKSELSGLPTPMSPQVHVDSWYLCEYARNIHMRRCNTLSSVIPSYAVGRMQKLEVLEVHHCNSLMEVFETQGINNNNKISGGTPHTIVIPRPGNINVPQLTNLKKLVITFCGLLQHVFTFSTIKSLGILAELTVSDCEAMEVIVKKENGEVQQVFPCLKFLKLLNLPNLEGFFLGENGFQWPLLEGVMISKCPRMKMFTCGQSTAPELKYIHTSLGKHSLECGLNFYVTTDSHEIQTSSLEHISLHCTTLKQLPWSFSNLIEMNITHYWKVKNIFPSDNLLQLHKLETIRVHDVFYVEEIFEVVEIEGANSAFKDSKTDFEIRNLRQVDLKDLFSLQYIWKNNSRRALLFPSLTTMCIDNCNSLQHVFTSSMVSSLLQLQVLHISNCPNMEVIIKVEEDEEEEEDPNMDVIVMVEEEEEEGEFECDDKVKEIVLPSLKSLKLVKLKILTAFCLGEDALSWPALHNLEIKECPEIKAQCYVKGRP